MLSANTAAALSVGHLALEAFFAAICSRSYICGRREIPGDISQSNHLFLPIGSLHAPLRLALLPLFNHPAITDPLSRRSFGHSSAHPLCHSIRFHLLPSYNLRHLHASRAVVLGNLSPTRLVSLFSPRYRQGSISHRTSLRRASL